TGRRRRHPLAAGARRPPADGAGGGAAPGGGGLMGASQGRTAGFTRHELPGLRVHVRPDPRFKRVTAVLAWQMPLAAETASPFALLPRLLRRGTRRHPDLPSLERALADLYGAHLGVGVEK